jgi:hypothetical protein
MSTRKFLLAFFLQWLSIVSFAKGINPETWTQGKLYELTDEDGLVHCLYLEPSGSFLFLRDVGNGGIDRHRGIWKRNNLNGRINFSSYTDIEFSPLDDTFYVLNDGLYASKSNSPDFIPAKESTSEFFLPQIALFLDERDPFDDFYAMSEIGYVFGQKSWHHDYDSFHADNMLEVLKHSEMKAQYESNEYYLKEKPQRKNWKHLYPGAWDFAVKEFKPLSSDTAKMRAMCNWMAESIEYKLKEAREQNPSHNPEFVFTEHFGLCLDYSLLLNVFCESAGIPCFNVCGYPLSTSNGKQPSLGNSYHAWNFVKVNGTWKAVDPTWYKSNRPQEHFLEDLSAYQYEHVPHDPAILANPFGPRGEEELNLCPVVKQSNTDVVYLGNFDYITVANGDELEVVLYSGRETELELNIDSTEHLHHTVSFFFTICFGCIEKDKDSTKMVTYHLTKGLNRLRLPLQSVLAKYTLKNEDFEISFIASPEKYKAAALQKMTSYSEQSASLNAAYRYLGQWLNGDPSTMMDIDEHLRNHPNWELLRKEYRNEELYWYSGDSGNEHVFEFGHYAIGGLFPCISVRMDSDGKVVGGPKLLLGL